ncbi:MAG TPA: KR domain-containing protein, partial [Amycolatopsis sp.]|nr:KR domain-containing protein [Amycolatopsis sp.]
KAAGSATDAESLGQVAAEHPMLGAVVRLPQSDGLVFTSRLSLTSHAWLADYEVVPGAGLVELAVRAGDEAECPVLEELTIETPLVVPEHGGVSVQVAVGGPDENGSRTVEVYSLRDEVWTRHATGALSAKPGSGTEFDFTAWPPPGVRQVDAEGLAVWTRGEEIFAEVELPEDQREEAGRFGIHPALLDAALQPAVTNEAHPLDWTGVVLHAAGASALRVRLVPGESGVSLEAADATGHPVVSADSVTFRALPMLSTTENRDSLFRVDWTELSPVDSSETSWVAVSTADDMAALADDAVAVLEVGEDSPLALTSRVLGVLQAWLSGPQDSRLVVVTRGAVPADDTMVIDPAAAAVWGLVRSAQAENPDRIVLLDTDSDVAPLLGAVLSAGEPQLALRGSTLSVPRLARMSVNGTFTDSKSLNVPFTDNGRVLVSGGGVLGGFVARHLVQRHGVRNLVLASRSGLDAEGVKDLVADLTEQGAEVSVVACDVSDRDQVAALLEEHRPAAVVHTAGVLDDGVIEALTPERLAKVFAPKVDAVRHLDELTRGMDLDAFVVFSSGSGVFGSPGQGNYAAANAFLDAAMANRRAAGLPGLSLAWGLWEQATGMTAHLGGADQARMSRGGVQPITAEEGMTLFDSAVGSTEALLVPVKLDLREVRAGGTVPHLLRGLVRPGRKQARAASTVDNSLVSRLNGRPAAEQEAVLVDLVRGQVAAVLGHSGLDAVRADTAFKDAGFDSLTSVELRNRLREATGLKLPATLVFDYPTPLVLARHLRDELGVSDDPLSLVSSKIEDVEALLSTLSLDESMKTGITLRLQGLVARCNGVLEQTDVATVAEQLESASADEIFSFIDDELGPL